MPIPSHYRPRTARGWRQVVFFIVMFALTQWPFLKWANRIEPQVMGLPFLYVYLSVIYLVILIGLISLLPKKDGG